MADVVAYGRHMAEDEGATVSALRVHRGVFRERIERRQGRVVDAKGDAIMAEFGSVVDAVASAVEIQRDIGAHNAPLDERRRMQFRVGINLGDVVEAEDAPYGDGVNIAARLETLAEPGGICISRAAYDQIAGKLPLEFEYLGKQRVKTQEVRAYRVVAPDGAAMPDATVGVRTGRRSASLGRILLVAGFAVAVAVVAFGLWLQMGTDPADNLDDGRSQIRSIRSSVAVLPFASMSSDPELGYFADGLTEDLITDLSRLRDMPVIARNSVMVYKGRDVDVRQVGQELGVRFVLEGSVRRSENDVRITAQLVDGESGDHLWAARYDRPFTNVFELQEEIARMIVLELDVEVGEGVEARVWRRGTDVPEAYYYTMRGHEAHLRYSPEDNLEARRLLNEAIALDPDYALPHVFMGWTYWVDAAYGFVPDPEEAMERATEWAQQALERDSELAEVHSLFGGLHLSRHEFDLAVQSGHRAVQLNPISAKSKALYSWFLTAADRFEDALAEINGAFRLNPNPPVWYYSTLAEIRIGMGQYDVANEACAKALQELPTFLECHFMDVLAHTGAGREVEARRSARRIREIHPTFSADAFVESGFPHQDIRVRDRYLRALRAAGLD